MNDGKVLDILDAVSLLHEAVVCLAFKRGTDDQTEELLERAKAELVRLRAGQASREVAEPAEQPAPAMTEPVRVGVCPNCCAVLGVPDSVRTYKDGRVRMYWECCGISVMSPAKAATLDARFQQQPPAMTAEEYRRERERLIAECMKHDCGFGSHVRWDHKFWAEQSENYTGNKCHPFHDQIAALDARFQQQKSVVPGTTLGLECVNQCGHTPDANTACWCCVEKALAKQLAELRERASRLINRSIESGYYSENSRLVLDDFAEQLLNGGANGTG